MACDRIEWKSSVIKEEEWTLAKQKLAPNGILSPDGSKLRRNDSGLEHSFIVIGGRILSMSGQGVYLGQGAEGKVKIAEDEFGGIYALKIITSREGGITTEGEVATDLSKALEESTRHSKSSKPSNGFMKHYIPYAYLGIPIVKYLEKYQYVRQDSLIKLYYKSPEEMDQLRRDTFDSTKVAETSIYKNCYIWKNNKLMYIPDDNVWNARSFIMENPDLFSKRLNEVASKNSDGVFCLSNQDFDTLIASNQWLYPAKQVIKVEFIRFDGYSDSHLSKDQLYDLAIKITLALHELHSGKNSRASLGYAHSDLHLNNITINESGDIAFIDFGKSSILDNNDIHTLFNTRAKKKSYHGRENDVVKLMGHLTPSDKDCNHGSLAIINEAMLAENKNLHDLFKFFQGRPSALELCKKLTLIRFKLDSSALYNQILVESDINTLIKRLNEHSQEIAEVYSAIDDLKSVVADIDARPLQHTLIMKKIDCLQVAYKSALVAYSQDNKEAVGAFFHEVSAFNQFLCSDVLTTDQITAIEPIMKRLNSELLLGMTYELKSPIP